MKWVRCPSCRTVNDVDRYPMCDGCNRKLAGVAAPAQPPAAGREAARDGTAGRIVLLVLGLLSLFSLAGMALSPGTRDVMDFFSASLVLVCLFLWFAMGRRIHASRRNALGKGILYVVSLGAAAGGALLLVFITCAVTT